MRDAQGIEAVYRDSARRKTLYTILVLAVSLTVAFLSIFITNFDGLDMATIWDVLMAHLGGSVHGDYYFDLVVWEYYVPRAMMAVFVGVGLAAGGAVMQTMLRNPLADPYTTGVASGASFGVALFLMMDICIIPFDSYSLNITVNAALMSLIPTALIVLIARRRNMTPTTTILAGVAVMYMFRAATSLLTLMAEPEAVEQLYLWNVGTLVQARWDNVWIVGGVTLVCTLVLVAMGRIMTVMISGDDSARSMGVDTRLVRMASLVLVAVMTAVIVGYTGTIGFMGLIAPHVARMVVGSDLRRLIPCSAACGALILVLCDCITKVMEPSVPVGVITSVIGGPIFIILLIRGARKVWD